MTILVCLLSGRFLPVKSVMHSALPFRAYNLIFNEWFRDENLSPSYLVNTGDGLILILIMLF